MCFYTGGGRSCLLIPLLLSLGEFILRDQVGVLRPCLKDGSEELPLWLVSHPLGLCRDLSHRNLSASISIFPTPEAKSQIHFLLTCLIFCGSLAPEPLASRFLGLLQVGSSERSQFLLISAQSMEKVSMEVALLSQVSLKGACRDGKSSYRLFTMDHSSPDLSPLFSLMTTLHHHLSGNQRRTWQTKEITPYYIHTGPNLREGRKMRSGENLGKLGGCWAGLMLGWVDTEMGERWTGWMLCWLDAELGGCWAG